MSEPLELDDDGYPTEETERRVREFKGPACELLALIKPIWWLGWGWHEEDVEDCGESVHRYNISTGGWSGNESIIGALEDNYMFWMMAWVQSNRGGHHIFEVPRSAGETETRPTAPSPTKAPEEK